MTQTFTPGRFDCCCNILVFVGIEPLFQVFNDMLNGRSIDKFSPKNVSALFQLTHTRQHLVASLRRTVDLWSGREWNWTRSLVFFSSSVFNFLWTTRPPMHRIILCIGGLRMEIIYRIKFRLMVNLEGVLETPITYCLSTSMSILLVYQRVQWIHHIKAFLKFFQQNTEGPW